MSNVHQFPSKNRLIRRSGKPFSVPRQPRYANVELRIKADDLGLLRCWPVAFHALQCAGGFQATRGFGKDWAASGAWRGVPVPLASGRLRDLLHTLDDLCAAGVMEVRVDGRVMGKVRRRAA